LFVASCAIISALVTSTTVFLPNYLSGDIKTNSIQPVSACWHFLKRFGIFYKWFGIFCSLGHGNPASVLCLELCEQILQALQISRISTCRF